MDYKVTHTTGGQYIETVIRGASHARVEDGALVILSATTREIAVFAPQKWHYAEKMEGPADDA